MQRLASLVAISVVTASLTGCGDDDNGQAAIAGPPPALTPEQCPAAPSDVTLDSIAPVWGGLMVLNLTVSNGTASNFDIELYDPTLDAWTRTFGDAWQRDDGRYSFGLSPNVTEQNKDSEFRIRIRSRLDGCPPSAWTEGPSFTLMDPLSDTTWEASWDPGELTGSLSFNRFEIATGTTTGTGTPTLAGPLTHTVTFAADGTFDEIYDFSLENGEEPLDGCSFTLHYRGSWDFAFGRNSFEVALMSRAPIEDGADGSSCRLPTLASLAINDAMLADSLTLRDVTVNVSTDYGGLLSTPEGPVYLESFGLVNSVQTPEFLEAICYETAEESGAIQGYFSPQSYLYVKKE